MDKKNVIAPVMRQWASETPQSVQIDDLPGDLDTLLSQFFEDADLEIPTAPLPIRTISLDRFPDAPLASGCDDRGERHARGMMVSSEPLGPIVVNGDEWWDGRHRVWAAKRSGHATIDAIDLAGLVPTFASEGCKGIAMLLAPEESVDEEPVRARQRA